MKTSRHFGTSSVADFVKAGQLGLKIICGVAAVVLMASNAAAQTTRVKTFPIRGGTQPFAITMGEDGNFWFTLSNSINVALITPRDVAAVGKSEPKVAVFSHRDRE